MPKMTLILDVEYDCQDVEDASVGTRTRMNDIVQYISNSVNTGSIAYVDIYKTRRLPKKRKNSF